MIFCYTGTPGSGKSLHAAQDIYKHLLKSRYVIGNFNINKDVFIKHRGKKNEKNLMQGQFMYWNNQLIEPQACINFARAFFERDKKGHIKEGQAILVIDECSLILGCREWQVKMRNEWIRFFQLHRHVGYNIILITQNQKMIDKQIRPLIEYEVVHRCLNNFKLFGKFVGLLFGGKAFKAVTYWNGINTKVSDLSFGAKKIYCDFYNSYEIFN